MSTSLNYGEDTLLFWLCTWQCESQGWSSEYWKIKYFSVRILTLPWTFTVRISSQKSYISTICNVRIMSELFQNKLLLSQSPVWSGGPLSESWGWSGNPCFQDSLGQVHNQKGCWHRLLLFNSKEDPPTSLCHIFVLIVPTITLCSPN